MARRIYTVDITINKRHIDRIVIDPHYEEKHGESISDEIVIELVKMLNWTVQAPDDRDEDGFEYYVTYPIFLRDKPYKLIWLLQENQSFLGIVNAFRIDR